MSWILHDPDEWESVSYYKPCGSCGGDLTKCNGRCTGSGGGGMQRRDPEAVRKIKADRLATEEADILAKADAIRARRLRSTSDIPLFP